MTTPFSNAAAMRNGSFHVIGATRDVGSQVTGLPAEWGAEPIDARVMAEQLAAVPKA